MEYAVYIKEQEGYILEEIIENVKGILEGDEFDVKNKSIFIKPSFVFPVPEKMIYTCTNPTFCAGVSAALDQLGAKKIVIGESGTLGPARYNVMVLDVKKPFKEAINKKLLKKNAVKFIYNDEVKNITVNIPKYAIKKSFNVPKTLLDADYFFSLPKLKVNIFADVTLSVKNHLGLISMKERLEHHDTNLHKEIADLYQTRIPDYVITDAIVSGEGQGPMEASPVESNLIIAGRNGLAVDIACCYLMGVNPKSIEHLQILHGKKIGPIDFDQIDVIGKEALELKKKIFQMPNADLEGIGTNITAFIGENCCVPGCKGFLRALVDGYGLNLPGGFEDVEVNIISGKVKIPKEELEKLDKKKTIIYGDCAKEYKKYGYFYKGCPPNYISALLAFRKPFGQITPWWAYVSLSKFAISYTLFGFRKIVKPRPRL